MPKKYDPEVKARAVRMVRGRVEDCGSVTAVSVAVGAQLGSRGSRCAAGSLGLRSMTVPGPV